MLKDKSDERFELHEDLKRYLVQSHNFNHGLPEGVKYLYVMVFDIPEGAAAEYKRKASLQSLTHTDVVLTAAGDGRPSESSNASHNHDGQTGSDATPSVSPDEVKNQDQVHADTSEAGDSAHESTAGDQAAAYAAAPASGKDESEAESVSADDSNESEDNARESTADAQAVDNAAAPAPGEDESEAESVSADDSNESEDSACENMADSQAVDNAAAPAPGKDESEADSVSAEAPYESEDNACEGTADDQAGDNAAAPAPGKDESEADSVSADSSNKSEDSACELTSDAPTDTANSMEQSAVEAAAACGDQSAEHGGDTPVPGSVLEGQTDSDDAAIVSPQDESCCNDSAVKVDVSGSEEVSASHEDNEPDLVLDDEVLQRFATELNCDSSNARDIIRSISALASDLTNYHDFEQGSASALAQLLKSSSDQMHVHVQGPGQDQSTCVDSAAAPAVPAAGCDADCAADAYVQGESALLHGHTAGADAEVNVDADGVSAPAEAAVESRPLSALELLNSSRPVNDEQFMECCRTLNGLLERLLERMPARSRKKILRNIRSRLHLNEDRATVVFNILSSILLQMTLPDKFNPEIINNLVSLCVLTAQDGSAAPAAAPAAAGERNNRASGSGAPAAAAVSSDDSSSGTGNAGDQSSDTRPVGSDSQSQGHSVETVRSIPSAETPSGQKIVEKICSELGYSRGLSVRLLDHLNALYRDMIHPNRFGCSSLKNLIDSIIVNEDRLDKWRETASRELDLGNKKSQRFSSAMEDLCRSAYGPNGPAIAHVLALFKSLTRLPEDMMKQLAQGMHAELIELEEMNEQQSAVLREQCDLLCDSMVKMAFAITRPDSFSLIDSFSRVAENEALAPLWPHLNIACPDLKADGQAAAPMRREAQDETVRGSAGQEAARVCDSNEQPAPGEPVSPATADAASATAPHPSAQEPAVSSTSPENSAAQAAETAMPDESCVPVEADMPEEAAAPEDHSSAEFTARGFDSTVMAAPYMASSGFGDAGAQKSFASLSLEHELWAEGDNSQNQDGTQSSSGSQKLAEPVSTALQNYGFVDEAQSHILSSLLNAAALMGMPVLLAGPATGRIISTFGAASGYGRLSTITLGQSWNGTEFKAALRQCSEVVRIENIFSSGYSNSMLTSAAESGRIVFLDHPVRDDIAMNSKGILNFALPVMTEMYVARPFIRAAQLPRSPLCPLSNADIRARAVKMPDSFGQLGLAGSTVSNLSYLMGIAVELYRQLLPDSISSDQACFNLITAGALAPLALCTGRSDLLQTALNSQDLFPEVRDMLSPLL
ncbi:MULTISPECIES: hypothetical protein [unclassified Anaerobiospirillum]|uniref:hypothetical protein n=1 Tax=unclassified Anaerobiospirillum TaxID=2647410 RepID=UPI001FF54B89|nr:MULTISPECIES: hypothetical protein [unclassified Anaerobiospirillum]MCK0534592.1 hypothetical protein [Anaerobiospirillum sp. NML120511]MCK0540932.1 hypothetical protein [Anaerobiospirillum sp. NML02-A-032]